MLRLDWFQKMDETHGVPTTSWFESTLRQAGPRVTRPRLAVHHHFVRRSCGVIAHVDRAVGDITCLTPAADSGYEMRRT